MKKIITLLLTVTIFISCNDFGDLNVNQKLPAEVPGETLFTGATVNLFDQMVSPNVNVNIMKLFAQYWTETTYNDEANYDFSRDQPGSHWDELYRDILRDLKEAKILLAATDDGTSSAKRANQMAAIEILEVFAYHILVDSFGDVPYTEALDINILNPKYDDDAAVYDAIIMNLDAAIAKIDVTESGFDGGADLVYNGNSSNWKKLGNSLKLRMAVRIAGVDAVKASTMATEAVTSGVFTSNADNAKLVYLDASPYTNPIWDALVDSGRNDFIAAETIIDIMDPLSDGRMAEYFRQNQSPYIGGEYGGNNAFSSYTHLGDKLHDKNNEGVIFDYSEVKFLLAEAAELNLHGTPADAEAHYDAAITASFSYWGATLGSYLTQPGVAYTTAAGTWQEKIGTQKWIALYNRGFEGWSTYRLYGYPTMNIPPVSNEAVPRRYTYPQDEPSLNNANWATAMGGADLKSTKIFWDVN